MLPPGTPETQNIYEVRFKTTRKAFYRNTNGLEILAGDRVVVEAERGYDVGQVTLGGELARLQQRKRKFPEEEILKIYRLATDEDLALLEKSRSREMSVLTRTRQLVGELKIKMKVTDVEFQGDGTKALFYYTSEARVDFRQLIKQLAQELRIRIEMRQIGMRQEAGLVGGIGVCGRELCCSTFLTSFKSVATSAARYQNISLNPSKITGLCGRLKCCLNYELDTYLDALKGIPKLERIETQLGTAYLQKTDIFKRKLWFSYSGDANWVALSAEQVFEIQALNKKGSKPENLVSLQTEVPAALDAAPDFVDVVGQSQLHQRALPNPGRKKKKPKAIVKPAGGGQRLSPPEGGERKPSADGDERRRRGRGRGGKPRGPKPPS
ncbi:MAG: regulatory iron-sulfur-containing complex subunit RicT [Bacteroidia bacterium]|nr:regulatory iron-sulfur-containing complex subunit RicT [Bacteroidia bacterium]